MINVLVVDDSFLVRTLICDLIRSNKISAESCDNPNLALEMIDKRTPDWLIINPILPYNSGFELLYEIQTDFNLRKMRVVLLSHERGYLNSHQSLLNALNIKRIVPFSQLNKPQLLKTIM